MQAANLAIVDKFLRENEARLLRKYMKIEYTAIQGAISPAAVR